MSIRRASSEDREVVSRARLAPSPHTLEVALDRARRSIARAREGEPRIGVIATLLHRIALFDLAIAACADALELELPDLLQRSIGDEHEWLEKERRTLMHDADRLGAHPPHSHRELGLVYATGTALGTIATTLFQIARARQMARAMLDLVSRNHERHERRDPRARPGERAGRAERDR